jgi:hypothetical protein
MSNILSSLSLAQLQRAVAIKEQVEALEAELQGLNGGGGPGAKAKIKTRGYTISAAGRARIAAAQRKRWAKIKVGRKTKGKRKMSAAGRAAISKAAKARWAKFRAQGR